VSGAAAGRDWRDLRERLMDLGELGAELSAGLEVQQFRFIYVLVASMAQDAAGLARDLETVIVNDAAENGVELPPLVLPVEGS